MFIKIYLYSIIAFVYLLTPIHAEELQENNDKKLPLEYVLEVPTDYIGSAKEAAKKDYIDDYLIGAGIIGVSLLLDDPIRNYFQKDHPLSDVEWLGNDYLGSGAIYNAMFAGMFLSGYAFDRKDFSNTAVMGFEKMILDMNICALLKHNVDRSRPNDSNNDSFTSGHTTPPASFASTISTMSDWNPWITGISYSVSIFTGFCRIEKDQHWFSDIVASHVLTTLTAIPMSKYWKAKNFMILPDVSDDKKGIIAVITF